jgi:hypothetical protein
MPETQTSPAIIALVVVTAALVLYAWWLSIRQERRFRNFVAWVEVHYSQQWKALPWVARNLNRNGGVEHLRRNGLGNDPQFMARYHQDKMVKWPQVVAILCGVGAIGLLAVGIEYFGWTW